MTAKPSSVSSLDHFFTDEASGWYGFPTRQRVLFDAGQDVFGIIEAVLRRRSRRLGLQISLEFRWISAEEIEIDLQVFARNQFVASLKLGDLFHSGEFDCRARRE